MLTRLIMRLSSENGDKLSFHKASLLQGVMMEKIDTEYAERLHEPKLNPYTQGVFYDKEHVYWVITTLNEEAYQKIALTLYDDAFKEFIINKTNDKIKIVDKKIEINNVSALMERFYTDEHPRSVEISFITPTAFKSNGNYVFYPDLRLIFQSVMMKYNVAAQKMDMFDEDTLEQIVSMCYVSNYNIKSVRFPLEKVKIPAFVGKITINIRGNSTMARYIRMLFEYGEYSGVGIKTAIGMGMMRLKGVRV